MPIRHQQLPGLGSNSEHYVSGSYYFDNYIIQNNLIKHPKNLIIDALRNRFFNDTVYINKGAGQNGSGTPYNTSNGYFTCPSSGYYQVYVQAHLQDQASGIYSTWRIYHNTTIVSNAWEGETGGGSLVASVIVNASGGDTLRATFASNDTTQYTNETYWVLHILKVG